MNAADLLASLERRSTPLRLYFRDDDAGWNDGALKRLFVTFSKRETPLDIALIPQALHEDLARALEQMAAEQPLGIHQHGFQHENHEISGRKCEFGPSRNGTIQRTDIESGALHLRTLLGKRVQPIFTPPWNRCTQDTVTALMALGFRALSRDAGAQTLAHHTLQAIPVHLDWQKRATAGQAFIAALPHAEALGVMLHHAMMSDADFFELEQLLELLHVHPCVRFVGMGELLTQDKD